MHNSVSMQEGSHVLLFWLSDKRTEVGQVNLYCKGQRLSAEAQE